jgi:hypothetical protein
MMKESDKIPGKDPFKVPENYFEDVTRKIISATVEAETSTESEVRKIGLFRRLRPALAIAASIALFVLLSYTALRIFLPDNKNGKMSEMNLTEIPDSFLNDIDIKTLEENVDLAAFYDRVPEVSNSDIIDYLILENVEINEIYELL